MVPDHMARCCRRTRRVRCRVSTEVGERRTRCCRTSGLSHTARLVRTAVRMVRTRRPLPLCIPPSDSLGCGVRWGRHRADPTFGHTRATAIGGRAYSLWSRRGAPRRPMFHASARAPRPIGAPAGGRAVAHACARACACARARPARAPASFLSRIPVGARGAPMVVVAVWSSSMMMGWGCDGAGVAATP